MRSGYDVTGKRELFIDDFLIERARSVRLEPHFPAELPGAPGKPCGDYLTLLKDPGGYLLYYRGTDGVYQGEKYNNHPGEFVGVARSADGIEWERPALNRFPGKPVPADAVLYGPGAVTHNFVPFYDTDPACPPEFRYKAVGGVRETGGLFAFHSSDGIVWERYGDSPVIPYEPEKTGGHMLDSQNTVFYSGAEKCYVMYYRVWKTADGLTGVRSFAKATSPDFLHWSEPEFLTVNRKDEHLYVSGLAPYFRAPHIYVGAATRYFGGRGSATDVTLLFSRGGRGIARPFPGAWIRPGLDEERWRNRMNYIALGMVCRDGRELLMYHGRKRLMYKFRTDGFVSLGSVGTGSGSVLTKPLFRRGGGIELNLATSAGGFFQLEVCDGEGKSLPGYTFRDFPPFWGDRISWEPAWKGKRFSELPAGDFRLRFRMKECDLYSISFPLTQAK